MSHYFYLLVNVGTVIFPLLFSFEKQVAFYRQWKYVFPAIFITALPFIWFDHEFAIRGIWSFNEKYITGIKYFSLPVEEILFFFTIPYACLYIYVALNAVFSLPSFFKKLRPYLSVSMLCICFALAIIFSDRIYTVVICLATSALLLLHLIFNPGYMGTFWRYFCIQLIPFFLVNGILTGSVFGMEVFRYRPDTVTNFRLGTIPVEDLFFSLALMLTNISLYESFRFIFQKNKRIVYI